ncbi:hypothetical protein ACFVDU_17625 [Streptomyces albidoflavus]
MAATSTQFPSLILARAFCQLAFSISTAGIPFFSISVQPFVVTVPSPAFPIRETRLS